MPSLGWCQFNAESGVSLLLSVELVCYLKGTESIVMEEVQFSSEAWGTKKLAKELIPPYNSM